MSITPAELSCYIELVSLFFEHGGRDPNEREKKAMLSVARMMLAGPTGSERTRCGGVGFCLRPRPRSCEALRMYEAREAREASMAPDPVPAKVIH